MTICSMKLPLCMGMVVYGQCDCDGPDPVKIATREAVERNMETRFWSVVDHGGLSGLPSDMWAALELLVDDRAIRQQVARNRDMWKGQCERQAAQLTAMRIALHDAINRPKGVVPASAEPFYCAAMGMPFVQEEL